MLKNKRNERLDLGLDYKGYIYRRGIFVIYSTGFYPGRVSGRVSDFLIKSGPDPDPLRVFFKKPIPDPILNLTG